MAVVALVVFIVFTCSFAFSQPKRGESFSPGRQKFNRACRLILCGVGLISVAYLIYSIGWGTACSKYDVDTDVYAIELKTDGHRMLSFMTKTESHTLYGEEAHALMKAAFGDTTDADMEKWNGTPAWAGKYTARVYYTQDEYDRHQAGLSPVKMMRNDLAAGTIYRFTICETGSIYCDVGLPERPVYKIKLPHSIRRQLFPW